MFDTTVPLKLKDLQVWFGNIIANPLVDNKLAEHLENEAEKYVAPSPTLKPFQRMQIYNQQYWWRLISIMQDFNPLVLRLFGENDFNVSIAVPYLQTFRPNDWCLNELSARLPEWIKNHYKAKDVSLVHDAASLDSAFHLIYFKPFTKLNLSAEEIVSKKLYLKPYVSLHEHPYDLFQFRAEMLNKTPDHWIENDFPKLKKGKTYYILLRSPFGGVIWRSLPQAEYKALKQFEKGATIDYICEWLEKQPKAIREKAEQSLQEWFKDWTLKGILTDAIY